MGRARPWLRLRALVLLVVVERLEGPGETGHRHPKVNRLPEEARLDCSQGQEQCAAPSPEAPHLFCISCSPILTGGLSPGPTVTKFSNPRSEEDRVMLSLLALWL